MAIYDIEAFIRERATAYDPSLDLNPGSPFDKQVIQPLIRRLGADPFAIDPTTFITTRLQQAFPEMAIDEGDALTDLFVKPSSLLLDPFIREVDRVRKGLSFKDPDSLTEEEADALGANLFATRPKGKYARGVARIFFARPQNATITAVNIITGAGGLRYYPTEPQAIRVEEMLTNLASDGRYYFDVNVIAENPGSAYNLPPNRLSSIANLDAAVQVTNPRRFQFGLDAATAAEFVASAQQQLSERSLVTMRGIAAKFAQAFPEVTRLNSVGFGDPEMQRDVLRGGGLGSIIAAGAQGATLTDTTPGPQTGRLEVTSGVNFLTLIGPVGPAPAGHVITVFGAFGGVAAARDLDVATVLSPTEVQLSPASMIVGASGLSWALRRQELTLSGIPGGILFPDTAGGTLTVPHNEVHIGGLVDVFVRGTSRDEATLVIDSVADDSPELEGSQADFEFIGLSSTIGARLLDFTLGANYIEGDEVHALLVRAARDALTLQVMEGVNANTYRILGVTQNLGSSPLLEVSPAFVSEGAAAARWRIFDQVDISLHDIKDIRLTGGDLITTQNSNIVTTVGGTNLSEFGVARGDTLRIKSGPAQGDYRLIDDPLLPGFSRMRLDSVLGNSTANVAFEVFRANGSGNLQLPLVRITSVELLDSSNQPLGTLVPPARPVDIQSRAFQNPARGVKYTFGDVRLGIVTAPTGGTYPVGGQQLAFYSSPSPAASAIATVTFSGTLSAANVAAEINTVLTGIGYPLAATTLGPNGHQVGIRPFTVDGFVRVGGTALTVLFGAPEAQSTNDVRSQTMELEAGGGWKELRDPALDLASGLDIVQVMDGNQVGPVAGPYTTAPTYFGESRALIPAAFNRPFSPEVGVTVRVGARSIGSARLFFLEPTSFEARTGEAFFEYDNGTSVLRFTPDPTLDHQHLPALPGGVKPTDGVAASGSTTFSTASQDLVHSGVRAGDRLFIDFIPVTGMIALTDPVVGLVDKTIVFSLDGSANITARFIQDDTSLNAGEVTREGVIDQINAAAGTTIAQLSSANTLQFQVELPLIIRAAGTANSQLLGTLAEAPSKSFVTSDQSNRSPMRKEGGDEILEVSQHSLLLASPLASTGASGYGALLSNQSFRIMRSGLQRISTTDMSNNQGEASLYYFDVELVSEGTGDEYNLEANVQMTAYGYRSDGYYLTTEDPTLTFSTKERPRMVISKTILEAGVDDDPVNATQLVGQNLQVTYERSSLVANVDDYVRADTERTLNANPLGRHLIPNFVRLDATYTGGSSEEVVIPDIENYITKLSPVEALEASDIQRVISDRGATSIRNPLNLIAIVHNMDRTVTAARSQDRLTTGRLSAFIPDILNIVRTVN